MQAGPTGTVRASFVFTAICTCRLLSLLQLPDAMKPSSLGGLLFPYAPGTRAQDLGHAFHLLTKLRSISQGDHSDIAAELKNGLWASGHH